MTNPPIDHVREAMAYADDAFTDLTRTHPRPAPAPSAPPPLPAAAYYRDPLPPIVPAPPVPVPLPGPANGAEPTRKRLGLNMRLADYHHLYELAHWRRATIVDTIVRSVEIARRIYITAQADPRWSHLPPADQPPAPYLASHVPQPDGTEQITRLELL